MSRREGVAKTSADGIMLIRLGVSGAKVHRGICRFLEETGQASYSRYEISLLKFPFSLYSILLHPLPIRIMLSKQRLASEYLTPSQVGSTPSRPAQQRSSPLNQSTGSTSEPPPSPATSTSAKPSVSAVSAKSMAAHATAVLAHPTTSMPPAPSTAKPCKLSRRSVSWSRMRIREDDALPRVDREIWTVLRRRLLRTMRKRTRSRS
jgi:hypothetical protein